MGSKSVTISGIDQVCGKRGRNRLRMVQTLYRCLPYRSMVIGFQPENERCGRYGDAETTGFPALRNVTIDPLTIVEPVTKS